ncbi:MAG: general secretion pathway protein GspK [Nitrospirota bacterium]
MEGGRKLPAGERGIALLVVLWVLTILMVIVFSFSLMARTETLSIQSYRGGIAKKFLAEAGIQRGIMEIFYRNVFRNQNVELEGREVWRTDGRTYEAALGEGSYSVRITDEAGKVDLNTAPEAVLKNLFMNAGAAGEDADIIVDSIMDWKDADDLHRLNGAESDYYESLPTPYKAKNARFDTVEELLMVKGVTPQILYGSKEKKGIIEFLTVHSRKNRINVKAAPGEVLLAIPGMTPEAADQLIALRESKEIDMNDFIGILGTNAQEASQYIAVSDSGVFSIDASGRQAGEQGVYAIRATVSLSEMDQYTFLYYKSPVIIRE